VEGSIEAGDVRHVGKHPQGGPHDGRGAPVVKRGEHIELVHRSEQHIVHEAGGAVGRSAVDHTVADAIGARG
jgi:hypothetical protein